MSLFGLLGVIVFARKTKSSEKEIEEIADSSIIVVSIAPKTD